MKKGKTSIPQPCVIEVPIRIQNMTPNAAKR